MADNRSVVPTERIERSILLMRGQKVMLDSDLADLYGVGTRALVQAVQRNRGRFPEDSMFQLTREEFDGLKSQAVISSPGRYVGAADAIDDDEPFEQKMQRLTTQLREQMAEGVRLDAAIAANLRGHGYGG